MEAFFSNGLNDNVLQICRPEWGRDIPRDDVTAGSEAYLYVGIDLSKYSELNHASWIPWWYDFASV